MIKTISGTERILNEYKEYFGAATTEPGSKRVKNSMS
jgi:hypothetical protein